MDAQDQVEAQLAALKDKFVGGLPDRLALLRDTFDGWWLSQEAAQLEAFHRLVHSLTGAGATFGCIEVSQAARELETYLKTMMVAGVTPQAADRTHIDRLLAAVERLASGAASASTVVDDAAASIYLLDGDGVTGQRVALELMRFGYAVESFADAEGLLEAVVAAVPGLIIVRASALRGEVVQTLADLQACQRNPLPLALLGEGAADTAQLHVVARWPELLDFDLFSRWLNTLFTTNQSTRQVV